MFKSSKIALLGLFAVATVGVLPQPFVSDANAAVQIKPQVSATGAPHKSRVVASKLAVNKWRGKVISKYGSAFANWSKARSRRIKCSKIAIVGFVCRASANPARVTGPTCRPFITSNSVAPGGFDFSSQREARNSAINRWARTARANYGPAFSNWNRSSSKSLSCTQPNASAWKCTARARPCK